MKTSPSCRSVRAGLGALALAGAVLLSPEPADAQDASAKAKPAMGGFCPVSYFTSDKPMKGSAEHQSTHMGKLYFFSSAKAKAMFDEGPIRFLPQFGGVCTTALGGSYGNRLPSDPEVFYIVDGRLYLFSSLRARNAYDRDPPSYIRQANDRFIGLSGYCPVSYQRDGKAVKGNPNLRVTYGEYAYALADQAAVKAFSENPDRYVPMYRHFCAMAISRNKRHPGDPKVFRVINDRTYLFWDEATRDEFDADATARIGQADEKWKTLKDL